MGFFQERKALSERLPGMETPETDSFFLPVYLVKQKPG